MVFKMMIRLDSDAMQNGIDLAEALRLAALVLEPRTREGLPGCESVVQDRNGNRVGRWVVKEEP